MIAHLGILQGGRACCPSGENQQKMLPAKLAVTVPQALILGEPCRGVDIGVRQRIHELIAEAAREGVSVLLVPSELEDRRSLALPPADE